MWEKHRQMRHRHCLSHFDILHKIIKSSFAKYPMMIQVNGEDARKANRQRSLLPHTSFPDSLNLRFQAASRASKQA